MTVAFDRKLLGDKVHYDPVTDTLVIGNSTQFERPTYKARRIKVEHAIICK